MYLACCCQSYLTTKGEAVAGVMYQPFVESGRTMWGMKGLGAFGFTYTPRNDGKLILATTRSHYNEQVAQAIKKINPTEVVRVGGAGHKALLVLKGAFGCCAA